MKWCPSPLTATPPHCHTPSALPNNQLNYFLICEDSCYPNPFNVADAESALMDIAEQQATLSTYADMNNLMDVQVSRGRG